VSCHNIIGEGAQGVLNRESFQPSLGKERNDLGPARAIRESSVHKHDSSNCHDATPFFD
jgi:hypothetical protein